MEEQPTIIGEEALPIPVVTVPEHTPTHSPFITSISYKIDKPYKDPKTTDASDKNYAVLPARSIKTVIDRFSAHPDLKPAEYPEWFTAVKESNEHEDRTGILKPALERQDSLWDNQIKHSGQSFTIMPAKFEAAPNQVLSGKHALAMLMSNAGIGGYVRVPCWHSGVWCTVSAPTDEDIIALDIAISDAKILFGRATGGLVYSNSIVYTIKHLMDFVLKCTAETTVVLEKGNLQELRSVLVVNDLPILLLGIMSAMYPEGYQYQQPCVNNPAKCQYILKELLDLSLLLFDDTTKLSDEQTAFMCGGNFKRPGSKTLESVKEYQNKFNRESSVIELPGSSIKIYLALPTIERWESNGVQWVDTVVDDAQEYLSADVSEDTRNAEIMRFANASVMRNYGHYVSHITVGTNEIKDDKTISESLARLSGKKEYRTAFTNGINKYIAETTIALVAIKTFKCPNCGDLNHESNALDPALIPLDVISLFFDTCGRRLLDLVKR